MEKSTEEGVALKPEIAKKINSMMALAILDLLYDEEKLTKDEHEKAQYLLKRLT